MEMNIKFLSVLCVILFCRFTNGLSPQVLLSMNDDVIDWYRPPSVPVLDNVNQDCRKDLTELSNNSGMTSKDVQKTSETIADSHRRCRKYGNGKFCRLLLVQPRDVDLLARPLNIDWTGPYSIAGVLNDCFPWKCTETDIAMFSPKLLPDVWKTLQNATIPVRAIAHCEETVTKEIGYYITLALSTALGLMVFIGTLLDTYVNHTPEETTKKSTSASVPGWKSLLLTPKEAKNESFIQKPSIPRIVISSATTVGSEGSIRSRCDSLDGSTKGRCSRSKRFPISFPSLPSLRDRGSYVNESCDVLVHRSPSCSPIVHSGARSVNPFRTTTPSGSCCSFSVKESLLGGSGYNRSHSFTCLSSQSVNSDSNRVTFNFSDPSLFVSPLQDSASTKAEEKLTLFQNKLKKSHEDLSHDRYLFALSPKTNRTKLFLNALVMSSARRGAKRFRDRKPNISALRVANTGKEKKVSDLSFAKSIQTMALWCIMFYNTAIFLGTSKLLDNPEAFGDSLPMLRYQFVSNAFVNMHTMFFTSAVITSYAVCCELQYVRCFRDGIYILLVTAASKYCRQFPFYLLVVLLWTYVIPVLGSGPMWFAMRNNSCHNYWWTNVLYISNFVPEKSVLQCMPWTWFLSCEMQMYLVGIPLTYLLLKMPRVGLLATACSFVCILILVIHIAFDLELHINPVIELWSDLRGNGSESQVTPILNYGGWSNKVFDAIVTKPHFNWIAYASGICVGNFMFQKTEVRRLVKVVMISVMSLLALPALLLMYLSTYWLFDGRFYLTSTFRPFLIFFIPKFWVTSLTVLFLYYRYSRHRGLVNKFLSAPWWNHILRFNFGTYILNPVILCCTFFSTDYTLHFGVSTLLIYFLASTVMTYLATALLMIFGHYPLYYLVRLLYLFVWPQGGDTVGKSEMKKQERDLLFESNSNEAKCSKSSSREDMRRMGRGRRHRKGSRRLGAMAHGSQSSFDALFSPFLRTRFYTPI